MKKTQRLLVFLVGFLFAVCVWADTPNPAFEAADVPTALRHVFGRSNYLPTDKIKILEGIPGNARPLSANQFGSDTGQVTLAFDLPGLRKIAILMEPVRARHDTPAPLIAIYQLADRANAISVPLRFPYVDVRITVTAEVDGKLWGVQELFHISRSSGSTEVGGRGPCNDQPHDKHAHFTGPTLDNMASVSYSTKAGAPRIIVSLQHEMSWEPVLYSRHCTLGQPRAIRSAQLTYDGMVVAEAEWGPGIARPAMMLSMPSAQVGTPLLLRWQDTRGHNYTFTTTVMEASQNGTTPLHTAGLDGDLPTLQRLLAEGANVNATLPNGWTPLGFAVLKNRADVVAWLLDHGADPNIRFQYGDTALMWAAYMGHAELFATLLARGSNATARDTFGNTLFALAVQGARGPMVQSILQRKLLPIVQTLIARGLVDYSESTLAALQVAAEQDNYAVIKALIAGGFNPATNAGDTPLLVWAVKRGYTELAAEMLAKGAPVNVESKQCEMPLLAAVSRGYTHQWDYEYRLERERKAMVRLLMQYGAKPLAKNKKGINALTLAESIEAYQKNEILKLLTGAPTHRAAPSR